MPRGTTVYRTGPAGGGSARRPRTCASCAADPCRCEPTRSLPASEQRVGVRRERSGRKGKTVTVIEPVMLVRTDASELLKELKRRCGTGGSLRTTRTRDDRAAFSLELQGDRADDIVAELQRRGFDARRTGG